MTGMVSDTPTLAKTMCGCSRCRFFPQSCHIFEYSGPAGLSGKLSDDVATKTIVRDVGLGLEGQLRALCTMGMFYHSRVC